MNTLKLEDGKIYVNAAGYARVVKRRPAGHQTVWEFYDQHLAFYSEDGTCFSKVAGDKLVSEYEIQREDGIQMTLSEIEADIEAAKEKYGYRELCFTWVTVESLVNKIKQLEGLK